MKQIILYVLIAVCCFACKPKTEPHLTISAELKNNYNYKTGSYWIYKDSISGIYDSFFVKNNFYSYGIDHYTYSQEDISIAIGEQNANLIATWELDLYSNYIDLLYIQSPVNKYGQEIRYSVFASLPYQLVKLPANGTDTGNVTHLFPLYGLANGLKFNDVAEIHHAGAGSYFTEDTAGKSTAFKYDNWFYINDSVGIIKMRLNEDTLRRVWEIQRWNIVK